jgi:tRNA threonylcarbamoyladenosine biosynthesis protein TsaE
MPVLDHNSLEFISRSAEQTRRLGMRFGGVLQSGDLLCLAGDLGSGKTTFVQGIAAGWGSLDPVSSPSFVLVNVYRGGNGHRLYHLDAYRLNSVAQAADLDLDAMLESGPLVVEWADHIQEALPAEYLLVNFVWIDENQRDMVFAAHGNRHQAILAAIRKQIFGVK